MQNLSGRKIHSWTIIGAEPIGNGQRRRWAARCDCGTLRDVNHWKLLSNGSKSCGCKSTRKSPFGKRHGHCAGRVSLTYKTWESMKSRCRDSSNPLYGARGIVVCERWREFDNFLADMGEKPDGMSIDRIDNNQGYSPENCRWATLEQQANNKRNNHLIEYGGERLTLPQWSQRLGIKEQTLRSRLFQYGWPIEKAMTAPPDTIKNRRNPWDTRRKNQENKE